MNKNELETVSLSLDSQIKPMTKSILTHDGCNLGDGEFEITESQFDDVMQYMHPINYNFNDKNISIYTPMNMILDPMMNAYSDIPNMTSCDLMSYDLAGAICDLTTSNFICKYKMSIYPYITDYIHSLLTLFNRDESDFKDLYNEILCGFRSRFFKSMSLNQFYDMYMCSESIALLASSITSYAYTESMMYLYCQGECISQENHNNISLMSMNLCMALRQSIIDNLSMMSAIDYGGALNKAKRIFEYEE